MEGLTLNRKEQARIRALNQVLEGVWRVEEAARVMGISERHGWRLLKEYRREGVRALAHGNRGRSPRNAILEEIKGKVKMLAEGRYSGFNHSHLTEMLSERERVCLSRSSVRRILIEAGIKSPRKRRSPRHRSRRERCSCEGMLLQVDGSHHDWLEGRAPKMTLISGIDDATGKVPYALFRDQEDAQGYFLLMRQVVRAHGMPLALYHDRHGIFERNDKGAETIEEQLEGRREPTQFGRLMEELGIRSISAWSPQAKGRIERLWGTFQDRLISELRLAGAGSMEEANEVLWDFLSRYNRRFAVRADNPDKAYVKPGKGFKAEEVFCFKYRRTVGPDNVVSFGKKRLQIMPGNDRHSYARARVEVQERMDGSLAVYHRGKCLLTTSAPPEAPVLRTRKGSRIASTRPAEPVHPKLSLQKSEGKAVSSHKPAPNHPWRQPYKVITGRS